MIVGHTKLGPGCLQMVKVMELLLFRKTADRLVTYRKLTRTPKEYWGPKNTALFLNLGPSRRTLPRPDTRLRKSPEPCRLASEGLGSACLTWLIFIISYEILFKIREILCFQKLLSTQNFEPM